MRRRIPVLLAALASAFVVGQAPDAGAQTGTPGRPEFITGTGDRTNPQVVTYDATGNKIKDFNAFAGPTGARVASGDVNGDIQPDIVAGTGAGVGSLVSIFGMNGEVMGSFSPYGAFAGGVNVGVGDVDGDTVDEIITAAGAGGGPHVIVWDWNNNTKVATQKFGWFAYDPAFRGGVNLSVFDLVNSTRADVVTGAGPGGAPHVRVWDLGSGAAVEDAGWFAYAATFRGGATVGGGEIDGTRAVVTGAGPGGGPHVRIFSTHGSLRNEFFAYNTSFTGGVNVIFSTAQGGDLGHVITAPASWGGPHVRGFSASGQELFGFFAYGGATMNGINLARVPQLGSSNNTNQNGSNSSVGG